MTWVGVRDKYVNAHVTARRNAKKCSSVFWRRNKQPELFDCRCAEKINEPKGAVMVRQRTGKSGFPDTVSAEPNKDFFVHMLTRDIELGDAILDLLDNCVDGIVRTLGSQVDSDKPYSKYFANITLSPTRFVIEDNCGGIPLELARTKAFHMGRPPGNQDDAATVGMYGIGMKRAIFKIGRQSHVRSRSGNDAFEVEISKHWLSDPKDWHLPIRRLNLREVPRAGTTIQVEDLKSEVARRFDEKKDAFVSDFVNFVSQHYSIIIEKGFRVTINGRAVGARPFQLLITDTTGSRRKGAIAPYVMQADIRGVAVTIAVGLYRRIPDEAEIEAEHEERASKDDAGWTIVCNDRVVLYRDKTRMTGWGEAGVPNYHGQFIAISGIVVMQSADLWKLPLTTTKRGIDPSSETFSVAKDYMREGIKYFTRFTNRWKNFSDERDELYKSAQLMSLEELIHAIPDKEKGALRASSKGVTSASRYVPNLPQPKSIQKEVRVSFSRPRDQVRTLGDAIFDDPDSLPRDVGAACFDRVLKQVGK